MKRNEFFAVLGISAGALIYAPFLSSCSKSSTMDTPTPPAGGALDFTLDLSLPANSALNTNGGSLLKSGVIVARTSAGTYVAVASACSHQGTTVEFNSTSSQFHCPNHGSNFAATGTVVNGPATTALKMYNVALTGTSLRVFA